MVRRLKEDLRQLGEPFPERRVEPIPISGLAEDAPELRLSVMLAGLVASARTASARFLFALFQQRLFSSIAAFHRTLTTYRRTLERRAIVDGEADDDEHVALATRRARAELRTDTIARISEMLVIAERHRHEPDARVAWLVQWIGAELHDGTSWRDRRLIVFTEWDDTRRWLVERLEEQLARRGIVTEERI